MAKQTPIKFSLSFSSRDSNVTCHVRNRSKARTCPLIPGGNRPNPDPLNPKFSSRNRLGTAPNITISSHGILIPSNSASKAGSFDRFGHRLEASDALTSNYRGYATNADLILLGSSNLKKKKFQTPRNPEGEDGRGEKGGEKHPFPPSLLLLFRPGYRPPLGLAPAVSPTQVSSECLRPRPGSRFQRINNWGRVQPPLKTYTSLVHVESPLRGIFKKKRKKSRKATRFSGMDRVLEAKEGRRKARWSQFRVRSNHRRLNRDGAFLEGAGRQLLGLGAE